MRHMIPIETLICATETPWLVFIDVSMYIYIGIRMLTV